jgi:hypothetical protein
LQYTVETAAPVIIPVEEILINNHNLRRERSSVMNFLFLSFSFYGRC